MSLLGSPVILMDDPWALPEACQILESLRGAT